MRTRRHGSTSLSSARRRRHHLSCQRRAHRQHQDQTAHRPPTCSATFPRPPSVGRHTAIG
ncbi:hypothetical protein CONPUDRAFT_133682 [Coniophora puteana RWD-64-598 SS2]|uniref:Uncharacterized protein n=1 Tax=Coniophora puteana (strain RWD-64-598) TaxID=741705 RepID=A0A5M3N3V4_CONPW|nr:uncharacterized protein CONPUDRAFT_133682 [Coniophora puteana RWD-64-598 SS2]EIW86090.1 hypothetical protein CONPUDRAFT_133682 [Coniophora puteana RWD-64-598 SS2]